MRFRTSNRFLIALAWGPRRVTRNTRYGTLQKNDAYPSYVEADHKLWFAWMRVSIPRWIKMDYWIVIPVVKASGKRVVASCNTSDRKSDRKNDKPSEREINMLIQKRDHLRANKNFEDADSIRDYLTSIGVSINDSKIK